MNSFQSAAAALAAIGRAAIEARKAIEELTTATEELKAAARRNRWSWLFGSPDARVFILSDRLVVLRRRTP